MTRAEAEAAVRAGMARLRRPIPRFRFDRLPRGDATPHVEGEGPGFDWVVSERGQERERHRVEGEELVFLTLSSMTARLAQEEELRTRGLGYSRATWMEAHERLMAALRPDWGARVRADHAAVLARHPMDAAEAAAARRLDLSAWGVR